MRRALWIVAALAAALSCAVAQDAREAAGVPDDARVTDEGWFAPAPATRELARPLQPTNVFVIPIHGPITSTTTKAVQRKIVQCKAQGAELVIFDMDTPGGEGRAMSDIIQLILNELEPVYSVAYVNSRAFSAGAIISLACDEIVVTPTAVIGDAMPIMIGPQGLVEIPAMERGKIESGALAEIRVLAKRNGYNIPLCEAMVTLAREVWLIRSIETRELRAVDAAEWRGRVAGAPATTQPALPLEENPQWQYVRTIDDATKLVTMTADEAVFLGFATAQIRTMDELQERFGAGELRTLSDTWSEQLVRFLTSAPVAGALLFLAILCGYVEMHTPGFGLAGTAAIICLALLFGSGFLVGLAAWWEIALFALGVVLIGLEVFVIPGFGIPGIVGILCCVAGLLAMVIPNAPGQLPIPDSRLAWDLFSNGVLAMMLAFIAACIAAVLLARILPSTPVGTRLILSPPTLEPVNPGSDEAAIHMVRPGDLGKVKSPCRPVGQVWIGKQLVDAIAEGQFIAAGTDVKVVAVDGNRVVVTPAEGLSRIGSA